MWTRFMDMHSGGGSKLQWDYIYIEGSEEEAIAKFEELFGRHPYHVTCNCCGSDYSISEGDAGESLAEVSEYERRDMPLDKWLLSGQATAIYANAEVGK